MSELAARKLPAIDLDDFERRLRHTPDATPTSEDPLSALARLVHKNDPFQSVFDASPARAAAPVSTPAPQKTPAPPIDFNVPQQGAADAHRSYGAEPQHEPAYADAEALRAADAQDYEAAIGDSSQYEDAQLQAAQDPAAYAPALRQKFQIPRKALFAGVALSVVAIAGVATAIGFRGLPMSRTAAVAPVIKAATGPVKVQPPVSEETAAAAAPSVLDKSAPADGAANSKVVSREEQPTDIAPTVKTVKTIKVGEGSAPAAPAAAVVVPAASSLPEPKKVKTVLVRPDGSIVGEQPGAAAASIASLAAGQTPSPKAPEVKLPVARAPDAAPAPVKAAAAPAVVTPAPAKAATRVVPPTPAKAAPATDAQDNGAGPLQIAPGGKARPIKTASRDVAPAPAAADDTVQTTSSTAGGAFAVQLAAPASEQEARDAAARAQKQYASVLGGHQPTVRKASDKDVYRVRVSNLSKDEADALCGKLKAAGGACFVAHN